MDTLRQDLRYAAGQLRKAPGFTAVVVSLAASAVPAWRATRVAPVSALRAE